MTNQPQQKTCPTCGGGTGIAPFGHGLISQAYDEYDQAMRDEWYAELTQGEEDGE